MFQTKITTPSLPVNFCMLPPPTDVTMKFVYSFFTPDESENFSGYSVLLEEEDKIINAFSNGDGAYSPSPLMSENSYMYSVKTQVPRYIQLSFSKPTITSNAPWNQTKSLSTIAEAENYEQLIRAHMGNMLDDSSVGTTPNNQFVSVALQPNNLALQMAREVKELQRIMGGSFTNISSKYINASSVKQGGNFGEPLVEGFDQSAGISATYFDMAWAALQEIDKGGTSYLDSDLNIRAGENMYEDLASVNLYTQINAKFMGDIMMAGSSMANAPFSAAISRDLKTSFKIQTDVRSKAETAPGYHDYEINLDVEELANQRGRIFDVEHVSGNSSISTSIEHIGYICEKFEKLATGERVRRKTIVFGNPNTTQGLDSRIRCGATYEYAIRSVAIFSTLLPDPESGGTYLVKYLWASKPGSIKTVTTDPREVTGAPSAPSTIRFIWDYGSNLLNIEWDFPVTPERDVKYFQVFRREKFWHPFQLIREYDFNDAIKPFPRNEFIRSSLREKMPWPKTLFTDLEFTKKSKFIYAIVAIDAHGNSSPYSQQFVVKFDEYKNELVVRLVSPSGAPKAYPNLYIKKYSEFTGENVNVTEDLIKCSPPAEGGILLSLSPRQLQLMNGVTDLRHVLFNSSGLGEDPGNDAEEGAELTKGPQYLMQVTNLDLQKTRVIPIKIHDLRS